MSDWTTCDGPGARYDRRGLLSMGLVGAGALLGARTAIAQAAIRPDRSEGPVAVIVFLRGGADGLSILAPYREDAYYRLRPTLALARPNDGRTAEKDRLIEIDGRFGLHPALSGLRGVWDSGELAFVHACGSADESRSHFEAMGLMERGAKRSPAEHHDGWLGRYLDATSERKAPLRAIALTRTMPDAFLGSTEAVAIPSLEEYRLREAEPEFVAGLESLYSRRRGTIGQAGRDTLSAIKSLRDSDPSAYRPKNGAIYPATEFGTGLKNVAYLIKEGFGLEVAALDLGGFDTHVAQGTSQGWLATLLAELGAGLQALMTDLGTERNRVTVVVQTEFGRRLEENSGFGTDHGQGGVMMVLGGGTNGGKVYGDWPTLDKVRQVGPGDLSVTTDYRDVLAEVVRRRMGVDTVAQIFPGLRPNPLGIFA